MGAPWNLSEARLVQYRSASSAANAIVLSLGANVPQGKCWIITGFGYLPSVAETKIVSMRKFTPPGPELGLLNPISMNLNPAVATFIEQGMEYCLFPGETIFVSRDSATAGSTMVMNVQFIEIDLPLYTYDEPQVVKRQERALSSIRQRLGGGRGSVVQAPLDFGGERGGRSGPLPK